MQVLTAALTRLRKDGVPLKTVYDIGAHTGQWTQVVRQYLPSSEFVLFEANPAYRDVLAASGFRSFVRCLSNPGRVTADFYNGTNTGDSYYKERSTVYDGQGSINMICSTLDDMIAWHKLPPPSFIKLDTQGSELDILAGADNALDYANLVLCECPIVNCNAGAPGMGDYLEFFAKRRFLPLLITEQHGLEQILVQVDILFMKESAKVRYVGPHKVLRPFEDASLPNQSAVAVSA